ncbi:Hypothetical protein FKW44_008524, partial [Caligus rogercresseyi]
MDLEASNGGINAGSVPGVLHHHHHYHAGGVFGFGKPESPRDSVKAEPFESAQFSTPYDGSGGN